MFRILSLILLTNLYLIGPSPAQPGFAIDVQWYKENKETNEAKIFISGIHEGISWSRAVTLHIGGRPTYCIAGNKIITGRDAISLLDGYIVRNEPKHSDPIAMIMIFAMQESFPCNNTEN
ncbi:hypothetical protein FPY71_07195 [Aureimonas fodinaquatilis]|uniref:Rap1a immunity protein domain-containing protein n=1 Tax=Aureimonas fodinaquatilis TaxID=2565783 RepID=A0A5B0DWC5_9HYPH|nr:hypothetical protein [Aureimonas fodinaquatilis]KAA0970302.1 hypothetical protein FPY71_07195 [Aureimonas fodinaquatilis]